MTTPALVPKIARQCQPLWFCATVRPGKTRCYHLTNFLISSPDEIFGGSENAFARLKDGHAYAIVAAVDAGQDDPKVRLSEVSDLYDYCDAVTHLRLMAVVARDKVRKLQTHRQMDTDWLFTLDCLIKELGQVKDKIPMGIRLHCDDDVWFTQTPEAVQ